MTTIAKLTADLAQLSTPEAAVSAARYFKTSLGQYSEGDVFIGVSVPSLRKLARTYNQPNFPELETLLQSRIHEERCLALIILVNEFKRGSDELKIAVYDFYLAHTKYINNWDLVDVSAEFIVGAWLRTHDRSVLISLAHSASIWERRIAIVSTFALIKEGDASETLVVATILLKDPHDLIQKAVGWMLREVGKRVSRQLEEEFLRIYYESMPRTMLRYAIEHFEPQRRKLYLKGLI